MAETLEDTRPEILKELDTFNTAPEFGMHGILQEQFQERQEIPEPEPTPEPEPEENKESDYRKAYAPLNTSIQELSYQQGSRLDNVERSLGEIRGLLGTRAAETAQPLPPNYDPDMPVTMAQFVELDRRQKQIEQAAQNNYGQIALENAYLRAHLSLAQYKTLHPDFPMSQQELDRAFHNTASRNPVEVRNANWTSMFDTLYNQTVLPKRNAELEELKKKNETLERQLKEAKEGRKDQSRSVSPSTRTTSRSVVASPTQGPSDLEILNLRSFKKGASMKTFGNDLKRLHGIGA